MSIAGRDPLTIHVLVIVSSLFLLSGNGNLFAQSDTARKMWTMDIGIDRYDLSDQNGWGTGILISLERRFGSHLGVELSPGIIFTSDGFYTLQGIAADLAATWTLGGRHTELSMNGGVSTILGGDSDGSILSGFGPHIGLQGHLWLTRSIGIQVGSVVHLWLVGPIESGLGRFRQSFSGGGALRF